MARKNPYAKYLTDQNILKEGIWYEDEDVRIKVTYAGDENARYTKMLKAMLKPYETRIRNDNFPDSEFQKILAKVYAATVVLEWEVKKYENDEDEVGTFVPGVYDENGEIMPYGEGSVVLGFQYGKRLFNDIVKLATNFNLFRQDQKEEDAKN